MINQKAQRNMKKIIFLLIGLFSIMIANGAVADTLFFQPIYDGPGDHTSVFYKGWIFDAIGLHICQRCNVGKWNGYAMRGI